MKKISISVFVLLIGFGAMTIFSAHYYMNHYKNSVTINDETQKLFLKDLKIIKKEMVFKTKKTKNAQEVLKKYIKWTSVYDEEFAGFYGVHKNWLKSAKDFQQISTDKEILKLDLHWLRDVISNYDYWNIFNEKEIKTVLSKIPSMNGMMRENIHQEFPGPNLEKLRFYAGINFLQRLKQNQGIKGIQEYRKVAQLIYSLGDIDSSVKASKMLDDEFNLVKFGKIKNWKSPSKSLIKSYQRAAWVWMDLLKHFYHNGINKKFSEFLKPEYGVCSGVRETAGFNISKSDYFFEVLPMEIDLEESYRESIVFQNDLFNLCNLNSLVIVNSSIKKESNSWLTGDYLGTKTVTAGEYLNHSKIPFWRGLSYGWHHRKQISPKSLSLY